MEGVSEGRVPSSSSRKNSRHIALPGEGRSLWPYLQASPRRHNIAETCAVIPATSRSLRAHSSSKCSHERLLSP